jgi:hypothetical protein
MKIVKVILSLAFAVCSYALIKTEQVRLYTQDVGYDVDLSLNNSDFIKYHNCINTDSLTSIISKSLIEGDLNHINYQNFYQILIQNELDESNCHFPRNSQEIELFNRFVNELITFSQNNDTATLFLIYIFDTSRRNIELIEYLQEKLSNILIYNTKSYINALANIEGDLQKRAIGIIEFIHSKDELKRLKKTINSYKIENKYEFITDMETAIDEELLR